MNIINAVILREPGSHGQGSFMGWGVEGPGPVVTNFPEKLNMRASALAYKSSETEKHFQTADSSCALEYSGRWSGVEFKRINRRAGAFGRWVISILATRQMRYHGVWQVVTPSCREPRSRLAVAALTS